MPVARCSRRSRSPVERGAVALSAAVGEGLPPAPLVAPALLLGFVAYGLSIFAYVRAQRGLGAAKTSAYYAVAPFLGALLAFVLLGEGRHRHHHEFGG